MKLRKHWLVLVACASLAFPASVLARSGGSFGGSRSSSFSSSRSSGSFGGSRSFGGGSFSSSRPSGGGGGWFGGGSRSSGGSFSSTRSVTTTPRASGGSFGTSRPSGSWGFGSRNSGGSFGASRNTGIGFGSRNRGSFAPTTVRTAPSYARSNTRFSTRTMNYGGRSYPARYYGGWSNYSYYHSSPVFWYSTPFHPAYWYNPPVVYGGQMYPGGVNMAHVFVSILTWILVICFCVWLYRRLMAASRTTV